MSKPCGPPKAIRTREGNAVVACPCGARCTRMDGQDEASWTDYRRRWYRAHYETTKPVDAPPPTQSPASS
jgi:hypothetical protein